VTLIGYGTGIRVDSGHLILEDGVGNERRQGRFARVSHDIRRVVVIGSDGMVSLAALRWLADQKAAFIMLERDGSVLIATGPVAASDARLRRAQTCAEQSGAALVIARELIAAKIAGQEQIVRERFRDVRAADAMTELRAELANAGDIQAVRQFEALAAQVYWAVWREQPVTFPKAELSRVPDHWRKFDTRKSPLTGSPQRAANPVNAILNYLYTMLEGESRLAIAALGLDPGLGFIHVDEKIRDSLACDLMEPIRPKVDAYVLDWITRTPLKRAWFFEQRDGNCRLMADLATMLAETAPIWRKAVAPYAEWITQVLWASMDKPKGGQGPATRLTQNRIRESKGNSPVSIPAPGVEPQTLCRTCGTQIQVGRKYCAGCSVAVSTEAIIKAAPSGRAATLSQNAQAQRSETQRRHNAASKTWDPASHPAWLTEEAYRTKVQPLLANIKTSEISSALGVTWAYASAVRKGQKIPHPRHWAKLAEMV
jgi:CRISPR-associated protein Cas1